MLCREQPANAVELSRSWQELVEIVHRRDLGAREAERLLSALQSAGRMHAERVKPTPPAAPTETARANAVPVRSVDEKMKAAGEIREVVQRYLRASPDEARRRLPPSWAPSLPREIEPPAIDGDGNVRLGEWVLSLEGDRAVLDYHPPESIKAHRRAWFRIGLARKGGGWTISPAGVSFVRSW